MFYVLYFLNIKLKIYLIRKKIRKNKNLVKKQKKKSKLKYKFKNTILFII